jgi:hypothetical protein
VPSFKVEWDDNALTLMLTLMLMGSLLRQAQVKPKSPFKVCENFSHLH